LDDQVALLFVSRSVTTLVVEGRSPECTSQSAGHCADNDPQSFRTGQPYFTYQLKTNSKIVTAGACSTTPPLPPGFDKITGGGQIPSVQSGVNAKFGFVAQNKQPNASVSYHDDGATGGSIDVHSVNTSVPTVSFAGNCGKSSGDAKVNQQLGYHYTVRQRHFLDHRDGAEL
jgi:hypothetical protein